MWRETKILLIDDDSERRRDLAVVLNFLGEENLSCSSQDWQQVVEGLSSSREVLCPDQDRKCPSQCAGAP